MPESEVVDNHDGDGIRVRFKETVGGNQTTITAYLEAREDLGLNGPGEPENDGVRVVEEKPVYYQGDDPDDENTYPRGYVRAVWEFEDEAALERARDRLYDKATERFEYGASDASDVQDFAGAVPLPINL